jgi:HK97 family phage prohead protease
VSTAIPEVRLYQTGFQLRATQIVGKPYKYLEGRAVPYDTWANVGWFLEAHEKGSLDQTTKAGTGSRLPLLLFHNNRSWPVGSSDSWESRDDGLHGVWRLNELPEAQQAALLAESGDLGYLSIGFQPIRQQWEWADDWNPDLGPDHMDRVLRQESRLLEVSLTPTPAFSDAEVTMVRTAERQRPRGEQKVDIWRRELEKMREPGSLAR